MILVRGPLTWGPARPHPNHEPAPPGKRLPRHRRTAAAARLGGVRAGHGGGPAGGTWQPGRARGRHAAGFLVERADHLRHGRRPATAGLAPLRALPATVAAAHRRQHAAGSGRGPCAGPAVRLAGQAAGGRRAGRSLVPADALRGVSLIRGGDPDL
ncbi:hypothetical protein G6F57_014665 [Rhizopus arrhizus]|nr:hypothetical protein G6F31_010001 [Rhizopus arrhizus]KAG1458608.1 hypothetical protein G6F57_014665 [Rhizopus arrhizus]